jgi:hypothetical protein
MRKLLVLPSVAMLGALAASLITLPSSALQRHHSPPGEVHQVLLLDEPFEGGTTKFVDLGAKGISPGDMFLLTGLPAYSHRTGRRIGTFDGRETIVSAQHDGVVDQSGTLRLRDGLVMVGGVLRHDDTPFSFPVIGGTGRYAKARGQIMQVREDPARKVTVLRLDLYR